MSQEPEPKNPDMAGMSRAERDAILLEALNALTNEVERMRKIVEIIKTKI